MRQQLLFLFAAHGFSAVEAAHIVGILMSDPYLGPLVAGGPPQQMPQGPSVQQLSKGVIYFAPY
jgi:hypothetical protein